MTPPDNVLNQLAAAWQGDPRLAAAWLAGSYGRGDADRWSDLDLYVLLAAGGESFRAGIEAELNALCPLVLFKLLFDGRMVNALTADGVRLDIWFHEQPPVLDPAKTRVLFDHTGSLAFAAAAALPAPSPAETAAALRAQIDEFWRCIALLPTVIGRDERIVAFRGLSVELDLLQEILLRGYGIVREAGAKKLNPFLPVALRGEIEAALALQGLTPASLAQAHLALAAIVQKHGRVLAERWGFDYPLALQEAVLHYVGEELRLLA